MARRRRGVTTVRIGSKGFEDAIAAAMEEACLDVEEHNTENCRKAGAKAVDLLKANSRKKTGAYARGWQADAEVSTHGVKVVVHNRTKPSLSHLLEKGHDVVVSGKRYGRAAGDGVIQAAADATSGVLFEGYD